MRSALSLGWRLLCRTLYRFRWNAVADSAVAPDPVDSDCPLDVIFVMDESGSVDGGEFDEMKAFVSDLVGRLEVDGGYTRVGIVTYSNNVNTVINMNVHSTTASLQAAINGLTKGSGATYTDRALQHVRESKLTPAAGDRSDAPNVVVVLTDGQSTSPSNTQVCAARNLLRKHRRHILTV